MTLALTLTAFGFICALWAQNTDRSPWAWFAVGFFLHVVAMIAVLVLNGRDLTEEAIALDEERVPAGHA